MTGDKMAFLAPTIPPKIFLMPLRSGLGRPKPPPPDGAPYEGFPPPPKLNFPPKLSFPPRLKSSPGSLNGFFPPPPPPFPPLYEGLPPPPPPRPPKGFF